jgi:hypothetical protein
VWLRTGTDSSVKTVSADAKGTELRVEHGRANVQVHGPANGAAILVDLPGGQVTLLKDGLYTFNAETNTVRVLHGEAEVYPGTANSTAKPIKVKEDHELAFGAAKGLKSVEVNDPRELTADLLPPEGRPAPMGYGGGGGYAPGYGYGYGPYGDGYAYPYPYAVYPYEAYGWGYPYWGYPFGFGIGFGYYGGFHGGYYGRFRR